MIRSRFLTGIIVSKDKERGLHLLEIRLFGIQNKLGLRPFVRIFIGLLCVSSRLLELLRYNICVVPFWLVF